MLFKGPPPPKYSIIRWSSDCFYRKSFLPHWLDLILFQQKKSILHRLLSISVARHLAGYVSYCIFFLKRHVQDGQNLRRRHWLQKFMTSETICSFLCFLLLQTLKIRQNLPLLPLLRSLRSCSFFSSYQKYCFPWVFPRGVITWSNNHKRRW